jgi:rare lipoprotein A
MSIRWFIPAVVALGLVACSSAPKKPVASAVAGASGAKPPVAQVGTGAQNCPDGSPYAAAKEDPSTRGNYTAGGLYKPGVKDSTPSYVPNVHCIPEPVVKHEVRSPVGNRSPYTVLGKQYRVMDEVEGYAETGTASYYGAKFHGRLTSNREVYDMYTFSAAHKTLPLPSFARVTNLDNGESVVVRVNDRGPFHDGRVVDLSYAAAVKLGITQRGTGRVEVRALTPGSENAATRRGSSPRLAAVSSPASSRAATTQAAAATTSVTRAALPPVASPSGLGLGSVLLQVASYSNRDNAERALGQLAAAGIAGASLSDAAAGGRKLWRLRVAANDTDSAAALAGRIATLGFDRPQIVRE